MRLKYIEIVKKPAQILIKPIVVIAVLLSACTADMVEPPEVCEDFKSYDNGIREIVRSSCNLSGCHDGSGGVGNYNTYNGIKGSLESGEFKQLVIIEKTMPKSGSLTEEEFEELRCWSENGYPEN